MSVYFVAHIKIEDNTEYQLYLNDCDDIFSKYNGRYLAVDSNPEVLEGEWNYSRSILIEFPSEKELKKWYHSGEYQRIRKHRLAAAKCDTIVVHGK